VVRFDPPLSLLRAPVRSSRAPGGEGPVLAFRDPASWQAAWDAAEASLITQCEVIPLPRRRTRVVKAMNFTTSGCAMRREFSRGLEMWPCEQLRDWFSLY
jgi:hypothetical protein